jgi:Xaa-Pro aminopeptidase
MCPIDPALVDVKMLSQQELKYLDGYHAQVRKTLTPFLSKEEAAWLAKATRPLK